MNMGLVWSLIPGRSGPVLGVWSCWRWEGFKFREDSFDRGLAWGMMPMI
jgi:hypothetical protein